MLRFSSIFLLATVAYGIFLDGPDRCETSESKGYYPKPSREYHPKPPKHSPSYYNGNHPHKPHPPPPGPQPPPWAGRTYPPRRGCEPGWYRTQREFGGWCMKVFAGTLDQPSSEKLCRAKGAVLSGLRTRTEINYVVAAAMSVIQPHQSGGVWIGIKRRPECVGQVLTAKCNQTHSFQWTDHSATGYEGMKFQPGEPNNTGRNQNCALLTVSYNPIVHSLATYHTGFMDDVACDLSGTSHWPPGTQARWVRAYVCGKWGPHYG